MRPLSTKEITLKPIVKVKQKFWIQAKGKYNVPLQSILPTIQKSKKTSTSQLPNQLVNELIKTVCIKYFKTSPSLLSEISEFLCSAD